MGVDKFGRRDKSVVVTKGVSLRCISNNFLRRDGTNTATGSINMTGNTHTNVSNPVNAQDIATKNYVYGKVSKSGDRGARSILVLYIYWTTAISPSCNDVSTSVDYWGLQGSTTCRLAK